MINVGDILAGSAIAATATMGLVKVIWDGQAEKIRKIEEVDEKQWTTISKIETDIATILERCTGIKETIDKIETRGVR